jgi:hypothetical protein
VKPGFLKKYKLPKIAMPPPEEKVVNASAEEMLENHLLQEVISAFENRDAIGLRQALEAYILHCIEEESEDDDEE